MRRNPIPFRDLLASVLPVHKLSSQSQTRVSQALARGNPLELESLGLEVLDQLIDKGYLRLIEEVDREGDRVRRYQDLISGNTIALRVPGPRGDENIYRVPLPLRDWKGATTLDQVRTLFNLYNKMVTQDSQLLRGPADILRQVMLTARQILSCERISFWAVPTEEHDDSLREITTAPYDEELAREWVLDRRYLVYLPELPAQIDPETQSLDTEFRSLAMVPVGGRDQPTHGVLHAWSTLPHHFDEDRQGLLGLLSECATDLLRRAQVLENLVFVDAGTQVYNRSYFKLQLENEIARAKREDKSLALAIADIDNFRDFNTNYGYEAGNDVLATAAQVLKSGLRPFDSVARWGGEEFALILTSPVTRSDATTVCERLRHSTELSRIAITGLSGESLTTHLTISIGGAIYPEDGSNAESLWRAANAALVFAKQTGKNKVVFASDLPQQENAANP